MQNALNEVEKRLIKTAAIHFDVAVMSLKCRIKKKHFIASQG